MLGDLYLGSLIVLVLTLFVGYKLLVFIMQEFGGCLGTVAVIIIAIMLCRLALG